MGVEVILILRGFGNALGMLEKVEEKVGGVVRLVRGPGGSTAFRLGRTTWESDSPPRCSCLRGGIYGIGCWKTSSRLEVTFRGCAMDSSVKNRIVIFFRDEEMPPQVKIKCGNKLNKVKIYNYTFTVSGVALTILFSLIQSGDEIFHITRTITSHTF